MWVILTCMMRVDLSVDRGVEMSEAIWGRWKGGRVRRKCLLPCKKKWVIIEFIRFHAYGSLSFFLKHDRTSSSHIRAASSKQRNGVTYTGDEWRPQLNHNNQYHNYVHQCTISDLRSKKTRKPCYRIPTVLNTGGGAYKSNKTTPREAMRRIVQLN